MARSSLIALTAGTSIAVIDPSLGGAVLEWSHAGAPVLRRASPEALRAVGVRAAACYPLLPYANRIGCGQLPAAGRIFALRANFPPEPHAVHGVGWQRAWQVARADACSAELVLRYDAETPADWPFAFEARQTLELRAGGLTIALSVVNRDTSTWPAGLGLHPNFPLSAGATLQFQAAGAWSNGPDHLPADPMDGSAWDFTHPRSVQTLALDHDFHGWRGEARIGAGDSGAVRLIASEVFSVLRVFTPVARGFFAVEPMTHITDAVRRPAVAGSGYRLLRPGETLAGTVSILLENGA
jgi:aldose 1-epimerase